jgi:hypothetical protein
MNWVTWENVGIDRMGCAWLIRTRIDPAAKFQFIPEGSRAIPDGATPFDIPGARLSHHRGHCSFHAFLLEYGFEDPVLIRIAQIIDDADTVQEVLLEPASVGLDLVCRGLRRISGDDRVALDHGAVVYDALFAQIQSEAGGAARRVEG